MSSINSLNIERDSSMNAYNLNFGTTNKNLKAPTRTKCGNWTYDPQAILTSLILESKELQDSIFQAKKEMRDGSNTYSHEEIFGEDH